MSHPSQPKPLQVRARFIVAGVLQMCFMYYFTHGGALGVGGQFSDAVKKFLFVFIPTATILFLLPVMIRGSRQQKILAVILSLLPAWLAFEGWSGIVVNHILN